MKNKLLPFCLLILLISFLPNQSYSQTELDQETEKINFNLFDNLQNISDLLSEESVKVFPTQSPTGVFTVKLDYPGESATAELEAFDLFGRPQALGKSVFPIVEGENEFTIELPDQVEGSYVIKIKIGEAVLTKKVFVFN